MTMRPMSPLLEALAGAVHEAEGRQPLGPGDQLHTAAPILRDALAKWDDINPFQRGDILMPVKHGAWKPSLGHVIVRNTFHEKETIDDSGHHVTPANMRVLTIGRNGQVSELEVHSRDFELVEPAAGR